jgi:hypothetical protein
LLELAARQGVLHAHQLPAVDPACWEQKRQLLAHLLAGKSRELPSVVADEPTYFDAVLDEVQREAVVRAVGTPDVCVIQGLPGSGKSRVAAEIVRQVAARGQRVLLIASTTAGLDRVLQQVGHGDGVWPLRLLHPGESAESLSSCVRALTPEERVRALRETAVEAARARAADTAQKLERRLQEQPVWERLAPLAAELEENEKCRAQLLACRPGLADEVRQEWESIRESRGEPFANEVVECRAAFEREATRIAEARATLDEQRQALEQEQTPVAAEYAALRPRIEARRGPWWTLGRWKTLFHGGLMERAAQLEQQLATLEHRRSSLAEEQHRLEQAVADARSRLDERRRELINQEVARRQTLIDSQESDLHRQARSLREQWETEAARLSVSTPPRPETAAQAREEWERLRTQEEREAEFARRWAASLEQAVPALASRLSACANLVASTAAALKQPATLAEQTFDLLLVEDTEQLTEAELLQAAHRARRWVLIGFEERAEKSSAASAARPMALAPRSCSAFARLWQHLHTAPRLLPIRWTRTEGRLCCRLRPVPAEKRQWVIAEPVADRPEVELLILAAPREAPLLVEVRFPLDTPPCQAKDFILRELQEVAVHARGPAFLWSKGPDGCRVQTGEVPPDGWQVGERVTLCDGVVEVVRRGGEAMAFETLGFEFDASWLRAQAEEWLATQLGVRNSRRTVYLGRLYRPCSGLASFLAKALYRETGLTHPVGECAEGVRLIAVPTEPCDDRRARRDGRRDGPAKSAPRGGAGFELDLSGPPAAGTVHGLPEEVRSGLPRHGLVNYPEAQALVKALEELLANPAFRAGACRWQHQSLPSLGERGASSAPVCAAPECNGRDVPHPPAVVVTALYEAQVRLLRLLLLQSASLRAAGLVRVSESRFRLEGPDPLEISVEPPTALRQRECLVLLLSLTRSHTHRAVALGEQAGWLPLALTRASGQLLVFGDAGTLARRTQWQGAVDHLDDASGERERELATHLLRCLPEPVPVAPSSAVEAVRR